MSKTLTKKDLIIAKQEGRFDGKIEHTLLRPPVVPKKEITYEQQQVEILKDLRTIIDKNLNNQVSPLETFKAILTLLNPILDKNTQHFEMIIEKLDKSLKAIMMKEPIKPVTELEVDDIERDYNGNMKGFKIKAVR